MKILLPVDGSECARETLEWVSQMFDKKRTQYYLVNVISVVPQLSTQDYETEDAITILKHAKSQLDAIGCSVIATDYLFGDEVDQICSYAEELNVDQVVIGSHGRKGFSKLLLGSVGVGVLQNCKRPVIVYRNVAQDVPPAGKHVLALNTLLGA